MKAAVGPIALIASSQAVFWFAPVTTADLQFQPVSLFDILTNPAYANDALGSFEVSLEDSPIQIIALVLTVAGILWLVL